MVPAGFSLPALAIRVGATLSSYTLPCFSELQSGIPPADEGFLQNAICNGPKFLAAPILGGKRQRFDVHSDARFTCDSATGGGARPLLVGQTDLRNADFSRDCTDPSAGFDGADRNSDRADSVAGALSRAGSWTGFGRADPCPILVEPTEIAKIARCVHPSPIGVRYNPELTAKVRRQYEDALIYAKGATNEKVVSNVVLSANVDITTPQPISYYGINRNDDPIFISVTGEITNNNPFPLSSVNIRCDYKDARGVPQSFEFPFLYTLGAGSYIRYQNKVINALPPHSVVSDISCQVTTAEIWQNTDVIQYLNAPLNPDLGLSARPMPRWRHELFYELWSSSANLDK
jgi:hypothetical protein